MGTFRSCRIVKDVSDITLSSMPAKVNTEFKDVNVLDRFVVIIEPLEGIWANHSYRFRIHIPEEYPMSPPEVCCETKLWHPNVDFATGAVCLSILRQSDVGGMGWTPCRSLNDVIYGLCALFNDLANFDEPLNQQAADEYKMNASLFKMKCDRSYYHSSSVNMQPMDSY